MSTLEGKRVAVVGGGVAGLTAAVELARRGARVELVEREAALGGLGRSYRYGDAVFDVGPHRFHTEDREVEDLVLRALGADHRIIDRSSAVWLYDSYHDWPLTRSSLLKLPPAVMGHAFVDLFRREEARDESLESYVLARYGRTLYDIFFKPYTEKFLSYRCSDLHRDWAEAGMNRAVIDKRLRFDSLFHVAMTTLVPPRVRTRFVYPASGGIDRFAEALGRELEEAGGRARLGAPVRALVLGEGGVEAVVLGEGERLEADLVLWTAPVTLLAELAGFEPPGLGFLAEVLFNVVVAGEAPLPYQWTYYGGAALSFTRASQPQRFNPRNAGRGSYGVCVEVVCAEGDEVWREPERLLREVRHDLVRVGLVRDRRLIEAVHLERVREAYPIYTLDYPGRLDRTIRRAAGLSNLALLGRNGTFWYNNMDHSIRQALDLVRALAEGRSPSDWNEGLRSRRAL